MRVRLPWVLALLLLTGLTQAQGTQASWKKVDDATLHQPGDPSRRRVRDDFQRQVGEQRQLGIREPDRGWSYVAATLTHVSDHGYFYTYTPDPVNHPLPNPQRLQRLAGFLDNLYPVTLDFWGITDPPHIEGDRRIVVLLTNGTSAWPGRYSHRNRMPQEANPSSHETGFISINSTWTQRSLNKELQSLAHELMHIFHHKRGGNDVYWVEEGLAEFFEVAFSPTTLATGSMRSFLNNPRDQLNHFPRNFQATAADYGAAGLFVAYLYERFGRDFLRQFAFHPQNGLAALDALLGMQGTDDLFNDWVIANYLLDSRREDGRFGYPQLGNSGMRSARPRHTLRSLPASFAEFTSRYSADYYELSRAALDESLPLLFRFSPAEPPQDAWLQLVQVLPDAIDVQRFTASQQNGNPIAAALRNTASRVFLAVSPFTPGDRRRMGPVFYSIAFSQRQADLTPATRSAPAGQITSQTAAAAASSATPLTFTGQVHQPATDLGALGRIYRASHDSGPALVVYQFVSASAGELAFWVTQQEIDAAGVGCVKASADRRIAAGKQASNNVVIAMGPDVENKTFHVIFDGGVSGGVNGISTTYDGPPGAGC